MSCYDSIAPSSPPQNVMITSVNPASLMISWQPPPPIDHNGLITSYVIQYNRSGSSLKTMEGNSGITISELVAFVDYSVIVAAVNSAGTGTFSDPVVERSGQDGELDVYLLILIYIFQQYESNFRLTTINCVGKKNWHQLPGVAILCYSK